MKCGICCMRIQEGELKVYRYRHRDSHRVRGILCTNTNLAAIVRVEIQFKFKCFSTNQELESQKEPNFKFIFGRVVIFRKARVVPLLTPDHKLQTLSSANLEFAKHGGY